MKRILVVEDDPRVAEVLKLRLSHAGYEVMKAPDPAFATMLAAMHPPDLIISDIWMPVMQGFSFIRRRRGLGLQEVPFIFITASRQDGLWESAMQLGASGYFEKPYDPARLLAVVAQALEHPTTSVEQQEEGGL